jgi:hypothetical protein
MIDYSAVPAFQKIKFQMQISKPDKKENMNPLVEDAALSLLDWVI